MSSECVVFHLICLNQAGNSVLGEILDHGMLRLPCFQISETERCKLNCPGKSLLQTFVENRARFELGIDCHVVCSLGNWCDEFRDTADGVSEMHDIRLLEIVEAGDVPYPRFQWISEPEACTRQWAATGLPDDTVANPSQMFFAQLFYNIRCGVSPGPMNVYHWRVHGWFAKVNAWAKAALQANDLHMVGRLQHHFETDHALVLTCEASERDQRREDPRQRSASGLGCKADKYFVKASCPALFEARRTATIAEVIGEMVPQVVSFDDELGVFLQRDAGSVKDAPFQQEELVDTVLSMQEQARPQLRFLEEAGRLMVLDSTWLEGHVDEILHHEMFDRYFRRLDKNGSFIRNEHYRFEEQCVNFSHLPELVKLRQRGESFKQRCRKITELGLPNTVVHGDIREDHIGKPFLNEEGQVRYGIFDWGNSFIGNPLHDVLFLLDSFHNSNRDGKSPFTGMQFDNAAALRQVLSRWDLHLSDVQLGALFDDIFTMLLLLQLFMITREYESHEGTREQFLVLRRFAEIIDSLIDM